MPSSLVVDIGNHSMKLVLFVDDRIELTETHTSDYKKNLLRFVNGHNYDRSILSSVDKSDPEIESILQDKNSLLVFKATVATPLKINYSTLESLGPDRVAASLAGWQLSGGGNVLVVVAGSCITYNIVDSNGTFVGGAISPGIHMRLEALNYFTGKLPLVAMNGEYPLTGQSTETSIRSGVLNGVINETKGMIEAYKTEFPSLKIVVSGGDGAFLAEALKNGIFARPELVAEGLNTILNYNVVNRLIR